MGVGLLPMIFKRKNIIRHSHKVRNFLILILGEFFSKTAKLGTKFLSPAEGFLPSIRKESYWGNDQRADLISNKKNLSQNKKEGATWMKNLLNVV